MNNKSLKMAVTGLVLSVSGFANAGLIAEYDLSTATASTTLNPTFVDTDYSANGLALINTDNMVTAFDNHFYHNGWDTGLNASKYYETSISSSGLFTFSSVSFSLENVGSVSTYWLRSSLDGYAADLSSGNFLDGDVTNFSTDLSTLGVISAPITFRWFIASGSMAERAGFANHECPGSGCGLPDVGQDLQFFGDVTDVPEPSTLAILSLGLMGLVARRFMNKA
jgi:hypothetical protein